MKLKLRTIGEIVAVASVVFSLLFVGYELRLSRSIAESQAFATNQELNTTARELISSNSDVWSRGCLGEELTLDERVIFNNIMMAVMGLKFAQYTRAGIGIIIARPEYAARTAALSRYRYPGFNQAYLENWEAQRNDTVYNVEELEEWAQAIENQYQSLIASGAPRDFHDGWCGR